jgi:hypothetical protein
LVDQETHIRGREHTGSRRARRVLVTNQSDHSPDPKADFARYPPNADTARAQLQRSLHLGPVALLDGTATELLTFRSRTSKSGHHPLSDRRTLECALDYVPTALCLRTFPQQPELTFDLTVLIIRGR